MRWFACIAIALWGSGPLHGGSVEPFGGEVINGRLELDFTGVLIQPNQGLPVKMDFNNLYRIRFDSPRADDWVPGVVLRDGSRLAAPFGSLSEPNVQFPKRSLAIPSGEIAWIVYQRFPAATALGASSGQTGALLPGGDFYSGAVRGADAKAVKVFNPIFGLRRLEAPSEVLAAVLQAARPLAAQHEIRTVDGSLFGAENFGVERGTLTLRNSLYDGLKLAVSEVVEIRAGTNRCRPVATIPQLHAEPSAGLRIVPDGGLITDTNTVTTCPVPAGFTEFVARVGPGDDLAAGQRIIFTLQASGNPISRSTPMAAGDAPQSLRVSLGGARGLTLRVESSGPARAVASGRWIQAFFLRH